MCCKRAYLSSSLLLLDVIDSSPDIEQILLWCVKVKSFFLFFLCFIFFLHKGTNIDVKPFIDQICLLFFHTCTCTYDLCQSSLDNCLCWLQDIFTVKGECKMLCFYFIFHSLFPLLTFREDFLCSDTQMLFKSSTASVNKKRHCRRLGKFCAVPNAGITFFFSMPFIEQWLGNRKATNWLIISTFKNP